MKRFINDLKKYKNYIIYATKAELKSEVIGSYLGWLWLILEPLCFMLIYTFLAGIIFKQKVECLPVFIFIGLTLWSFFNKTVQASVKLVQANKETVTKVYLPKYILLIVKITENGFKMFVSFILCAIFMIIYKVSISWTVLWIIPILIATITFTFGVCTLMMHIGVFIEDLANITAILLRMMFYFTGVFYDLSAKIHNPIYRTILLELNPMANFIYNARNVLLYRTFPVGMWMLLWFIVGILLSILGISTIYKYENTYVKVMR